MTTSAHEALSRVEKATTKEEVLKLIPQFEIGSILRRHNIDRELIVGTIGLRGDGKSGTDATISLVDFMLEGKPVWSNLEIKCDIEIDDETARQYGLNSGGVAHYATEPLEKEALLNLDERYFGGCLHIEEINVQYSNVRRFMSNTNIDFNAACQQLRKFGTSLIYNVIDEMFIDNQLRYLTDVFIKCEDMAFSVDGLAGKKLKGQDIKWIIYPMSGYLVGRENSYYVTKKTLPPVYFHFQKMWGIYDDKKYQRKGIYSTNLKGKRAQISIESSGETQEAINEWGWLADKAQQLKRSGTKELQPYELWQFLGLAERNIRPDSIGGILQSFGIYRDNSKRVYRVSQFKIEDMLARGAAEQ